MEADRTDWLVAKGRGRGDWIKKVKELAKGHIYIYPMDTDINLVKAKRGGRVGGMRG